MKGPLEGFRIIEIGGIGPAPFAGMLLADLGADVIRVDRPGMGESVLGLAPDSDLLNRGKRSVAIDLKDPRGVSTLLDLVRSADALVEGFRPGVAERLGVGPEVCLAKNPKLVYGRMTGWGQEGPLANSAGHDINYIAVTGILDAIGTKEKPAPPLNLIGDFGGGGMYLVVGLLSGLLDVERGSNGHVVDAAMVDGVAHLSTVFHALLEAGLWDLERGTNSLDGGAPFYDTYETSDGEYVAVGAIEPKFYRKLLEGLGLDADEMPPQMDRRQWPSTKQVIAQRFRQLPREDWMERFAHLDACVSPVLNFEEARESPHLKYRRTFLELNGVAQPAPSPRFDGSACAVTSGPPRPGQDSREVLSESGLEANLIDELIASDVVAQTNPG